MDRFTVHRNGSIRFYETTNAGKAQVEFFYEPKQVGSLKLD